MDMERLGIALHSCWLWLRRSDPDQPWVSLPFSKDKITIEFFNTSVRCALGNREYLLFWSDPWWQGCRLCDLALDLVATVPLLKQKRRTVARALQANTWMRDIKGPLTVHVLMQYLDIRSRLEGVALSASVPNAL
jgi:hypothetical protein